MSEHAGEAYHRAQIKALTASFLICIRRNDAGHRILPGTVRKLAFVAAACLHHPVLPIRLKGVDLAIKMAGGKRYAILPGFAAYWVKGEELDPSPIDWPYFEMLPNPKMVTQFEQSVADQKGKTVLIIQKIEPGNLSHGFLPLNEPAYPASVMFYARTYFVKIGETRFFELRQ